ncbi:MAG: translocation/assembly module TamB domain-containing protein [Lewinellaceae bacterium]|nr:translocation/assembly module TamB domain-containing protein [Lewinellaceae bacterium]
MKVNRIFKIFKYLVIGIVVLLLTLMLLSQVKSVQNAAAQKGVTWLAQKTGSKVGIRDFRWRKLRRLEVNGFYMLDLQGDTLLAMDKLRLVFSPSALWKRKVVISELDLSDGLLRLRSDEQGITNYQFILDAFASDEPPAPGKPWEIDPKVLNLDHIHFDYLDEQTGTQIVSTIDSMATDIDHLDLLNQQIAIRQLALVHPLVHYLFDTPPAPDVLPATPVSEVNFPGWGWRISVKTLGIQNGEFKYRKKNNHQTAPAFDPQNIAIKDFQLDVGAIEIGPAEMGMDLRSLALKDHSGIEVKQLSSQMHFTDKILHLDDFDIHTNDSQVKQSLQLSYPDFNSLVHITSQDSNRNADFQVQWVIKESRIAPKDIHLLLPEVLLPDDSQPITIDADIQGSLAALFIQQLDITQGADLRLAVMGQLNHWLDKERLNFELDLKTLTADYKKMQSVLPKGTLPPALESWGNMQLSALINGRLADFQTQNINLKTESGPQLLCNAHIKGLPDYKTALFEIQIDHLLTHPDQWKGFASDSLPAFVDDLGNMALTGTYAGSLTDFTTDLLLRSDMGQLQVNAAFNFTPDYSNAAYKGDIALKQFDLGKVIGDPLLSTVTLIANVEGKGLLPEDWDTQLSAILSDMTYKGYTYNSLSIAGRLEKSVFDGLAQLKDPNLNFTYEGLISLADTVPAYHFVLQVDTIDFKALGLSEDPLGLHTRIAVNCSNPKVDQLEGDLFIDYLTISDAAVRYQTDSIIVSSHLDALYERQLKVQSDLLSFGLTGTYELSQLPRVGSTWLDTYFLNSNLLFRDRPDEKGTDRDTLLPSPTNISAYLHLNDPTALTSIFLPDLKKLEALDLTLQFDNTRDIWNIQGVVPNLEYAGYRINGLHVSSRANADGLQTLVFADSLHNGAASLISQPQLTLVLQNDSLQTDLTSSGPDTIYSHIGGNLTQEAGTLVFRFNEKILLDRDDWTIAEDNQIRYDRNQQWIISNMAFQKQKESIFIEGQGDLSDSTSLINISFDHFDLNYIGMLLGYPDGYTGGILDGKTTLSDIQANLHYRADLNLQGWKLDTVLVGNLNLKATQLINQPLIHLEANLAGEGSTIRANGQYDIDQRQFDAVAEVEKLEMRVLDPFVKGLIHDSEGYLNGQFSLKGSPDQPVLNGTLVLNNIKTVIDYVNTTYQIDTGFIIFTEDEIDFGTLQMTDVTNQVLTSTGKVSRPVAILSGKVRHQFFDQIAMDLRFKTDRFQFLNTTAKDNELFYGTLLLKTDISINGPVAQPEFNINARTEPGTKFFVVPLTEEQSISKEDFIVFGQPAPDSLGRDTNYVKNYKLTSPGIDLQLNLELTPDAELQVIIDPLTGDKLVCRGRSALTVEMDQAGNVLLNGNYSITEGTYTFNYEQLLKRAFKISEGSSIVFNGDPLKAKLDITTLYETRANLTDLVPDYPSALNQRANVQLQMKIKGDLINPVLTFDILLPGNTQGSLAEAAKTRLDQIRNNETELNTQVFGLLLFNSFLSSANNSGSVSNAGEAVLLSSVSKLVTSQLNNFANKLIKGVDLTLGVEAYNPGDDVNINPGVSTEVQLGLSKRIFNDHLAIKVGGNLNVGASGEDSQVLTAFTSDFALEYSLTPSGNYLLRVYRQSDYDALSEGNVTRTGTGISIRKKFKNKERKRKK